MQHIFFATLILTDMEIKTKNEIHYTDSIHYELEQTAKLMKMLTVQLFEKLDIKLSLDECVALDLISVKKEICQRDLAKLILKDRANTGRILSSLEEKGLIKRFIDTKNNRLVKKMTITKCGAQTLNQVTEKIKTHLETATSAVSHDEIKKVQEVLKNFRIDLEKIVQMKI